MSNNLKNELHKYELYEEKFIKLYHECIETLSILKENGINGGIEATAKYELEKASITFENLAKLFDAHKMQLEKEDKLTEMGCVYAAPDFFRDSKSKLSEFK